MKITVKEAVQAVQERINSARIRSGRTDAVKLMAVSKFHSIQEIEQAIEAGISLFGENRVQEALLKFPELFAARKGIELHMIGTLQRNKVKSIVPLVSCIQSVDRIQLIEEIIRFCSARQKKVDILLEVHTGEESKSGFLDEEQVMRALDLLTDPASFVIPRGFMTMAPFTNNENDIRLSFKKLYSMQQRARQRFPSMQLDELSMGMSNDFEIAVEEGATLVRVGSAIFGNRE